VTGQTTQAGTIDEAGAGRTTPGGDALLLRVPFQATTRGEATFTSLPADNLPASDVLLFGIDGPVPNGPVPLGNVSYGTATITVKGPPDANDDSYEVREDESLTKDSDVGVLNNDTDEEGDPLTAVLDEEPQHGTLTLNDDGSFVYTPEKDFFGTDQFTYKANDGNFDSTPATVTITVNGVNDPPVAADDQYTMLRNAELTVAAPGVLSNDRDADGDSPKAQLQDAPEHGDVTLNENGSFTYTPDENFGGHDSFTYVAADAQSSSNVATVEIEVIFPWQNPTHNEDVNGDGFASPIDSLIVLNDVARNGSHSLASPPVPPEIPPPFPDVNGDVAVSKFDSDRVLQYLNTNGSGPLSGGPLLPYTPDVDSGVSAAFRIETRDENGQVASTFGLGDTLWLRVYVRDGRSTGTGVFSAYLDVAYAEAGFTVPAQAAIAFGSTFADVQAGTTGTPGLLDEVGAVQAIRPGNKAEVLLFQIPLLAKALGQFQIQANPADNLPASDVTLFGLDGPVPTDQINYGAGTTVTIVQSDADGDGVRDRVEGGAPNNGDGNSDQTADAQQSHVASFLSAAADRYVTLIASSQTPLRNVATTVNPSPGNAPSDVEFPLGLFRFDVSNVATGAAATVAVRLESGAAANTVYRYGPTPDNATPHWYPFLFDGQTGAVIYSNRIELRFVEGRRGDDNSSTSGVTVGVVALGYTATPWRNPVRPEDVNNDGVVTPTDALQLINEINSTGPRDLPPVPTGTSFLPPLVDPNGDNQLSAADVLHVINYLNSVNLGEGEAEGVDSFGTEDGSQMRLAWSSEAVEIAHRGFASPTLLQTLEGTAQNGLRSPQADARFTAPATAKEVDPQYKASSSRHAAFASLARADRLGMEEILLDIAEDIAGSWQSPMT
jgi:VCBS repeat-containing protein